MKSTIVPFMSIVLLGLVACDSGPTADTSSLRVSSSSAAVTSSSPTDPLEGEWHQRFTCEEQVRTFQRNVSDTNMAQRQGLSESKGNSDASVLTVLKEYTREFAWGPNAPGPLHGALTASQLQPTVLCKGAPARQRTIRFQDGYLVVQDWDQTIWGGSAVYRFLTDHIIRVNDGGANFGAAGHPDTFSFRIDRDSLTLTDRGHDLWVGTFLEEAPWHRVD